MYGKYPYSSNHLSNGCPAFGNSAREIEQRGKLKQAPMRRDPGHEADPIEQAIEASLKPRAFIHDRECFSFVNGLEAVAAKIVELIESDPQRACTLYEAFLAGCTAKANELDDSIGMFGQFAGDVICGWIKARCAGGTDRDETAVMLLAWMDDDPFAFFHDLEKPVIEAFDRNGLAAFERRVRSRFEALAATAADPEALPGDRPEYLRRRWSGMLRAIYLAQKDREAYVALTAETGLTLEDCLALAKLDRSSGRPQEALTWIERGDELCRTDSRHWTEHIELTRLRCELLAALDRTGEALSIAWTEFEKRPSQYTYMDLMRFVDKPERSGWHAKALDAARGADLHTLIDLLIAVGETERLAALISDTADEELQEAGHFATEPAARALEDAHPELAARLWRAQGMRIVEAAKSKYYHAALANFARTKECYERAGLAAEWESTVRRVTARHYRKLGFVSSFRTVVSGSYSEEPPSFLDRAKTNWRRRYGSPTA